MKKISDSFKLDSLMPPQIRPGVSREKDGVRFTAVLNKDSRASLLLYEKGSAEPVMEEAFPDMAQGLLRTMKICGLPWKQYEYNLKVDGKIVCDPYAVKIIREEKTGVCRCGFDFREYDWKQDEFPNISWNDAVMYDVHVRNFTMHPKSGVRQKGTFRGLQEKISYLKKLGINQVKLMPIYEYEETIELEDDITKGMPASVAISYQKEKMETTETDKKNRWGYAKGAYYALKASYAATDDPVKEFKDLVRTFHENKMEVLLEMFFSEQMTMRDILDCLSYWVHEYHVDGFLFVGRDDFVKYLLDDPVLSGRKLISASSPEEAILKRASGRVYAEYNDGFKMDMRRLLKGDEGMLESFVYHMKKNPAESGIINYITSHDGFTLQDLVSYDQKHNEENGEGNEDGAAWNFSWNCGVEGPTKKKTILQLRRRMVKNAFLMMLLSQGTPMILAGDEFGNSQNGNNNPYCLDNETSWTDWGAKKKNQSLTEFVEKALKFRKEHTVLHQKKELRMADYRSVGTPDLSCHSKRAWYGGFEYESRQIGLLYCGEYCGESEFLYVACNFHPLEQELALPKLKSDKKWTMVIDTSKEESFSEEGWNIAPESRSCVIPERCIQVFIGRKG